MKKYPLSIIILVLFSCSTTRLDDETAALVDGEKISADDLRYSVNFFPQYAANKQGRDLVDAHLQLLIDKKLFAQAGRKEDFDKRVRVRQIVDWATKDQMIRALYRDEIRNKIQISEEQIREAFFLGREQVRLRHLFVGSEAEAQQIKAQLDAGVPFEKIAAETFQDSTLRRNGGDLGFVGYDDLDENLAEVAFLLPEGQISAPVRSRWGYHILCVDQKKQQIFNTDAEYLKQHDTIAKDLRRRLETKAAGAFVSAYMAPNDVKMINPAFNLLAAKVQQIVLDAGRMLPNYRPMIGGAEMELMRKGLTENGKQALITFKGGQWTIEDFLHRLASLPMSDRPRLDTPGHLRHDIGVMIMREFLAQEAERRGLDKDQGVREAVRRWEDDYTFSEFWQSVCDTIKVSENVKKQFFSGHQGRYREEEKVKVREILVDSKEKAEALLSRLRRGADFAALAQQYTQRPGVAGNGGDLGLLKRYDYGNVSLKAFEMQPGQIGGPVLMPQGYALVKNEGYFPSRPSTLDEAQAQIGEDARQDRQQTVYEQMKQTLKIKATILINEKVVAQIASELPRGERIQMVGMK